MKAIVNPKCPYCHAEYKPQSAFNNPLSGLSGEYHSNTIKIICQQCRKEYFVSRQIRYIARKYKE